MKGSLGISWFDKTWIESLLAEVMKDDTTVILL